MPDERPVPMLACLTADQRLLAIGHEAVRVLGEARVPHVVGGGVALWAYGRRRNTKDIDLFLSAGRQIEALDALARRDFHTRETDAAWLYKAQKADVTIDLIIYTTGDIRVDDETYEHARSLEIDGYGFTLMGPEDVLIRKILSTSEIRFHDWYDGLSIVARRDSEFDWGYFLRRARSYPSPRILAFALYAMGDEGHDVIPAHVLDALLDANPVARSRSNTA